ncbi:hypothetical protein CRG98_022991 [Punica granatum]|uniref:Uncharacterized protein n=1 Tax=Punica granatum TaxID=22663 RepID=A0A2I0JK20_PUNGR|nr:hypothetical protein CRG98_022991 [Punica granatum]
MYNLEDEVVPFWAFLTVLCHSSPVSSSHVQTPVKTLTSRRSPSPRAGVISGSPSALTTANTVPQSVRRPEVRALPPVSRLFLAPCLGPSLSLFVHQSAVAALMA